MATNRPTRPSPTAATNPESRLVRVRDNATGHEYTLDHTLTAKGVTVIDKPATDREGKPLPPKMRTTLPTPPQTTDNQPSGAADQAAAETA